LCGAIFAFGLLRFARSQPDPWLTFVVAVPYLIVVVAMGYTRQAVAIGIIMAGLAALKRGASILNFAIYVAVAALFHKTVVIVLPLVAYASPRNRLINLLAGIAGFVLLYDIFLSSSVEDFVANYVATGYSSQGAAIRVVMNLIPALALFLFRHRIGLTPIEQKIWTYFSVAAVVMLVALFVVPSTTVVDRLSLYLIPLQLAVLPRLASLFKAHSLGRFLIIVYSALVLLVWLNFAVHAEYWLPYRIYPL
ncbi:MAG TPA: EpsG family protein, partial [Sphingomicrobium sp.]|nr:EpsG family protein [Sphingomicrobium sp.]